MKKKRTRAKKQFCIHGHEIAKVGRNKAGACNACNIPYKQKWFKEHYIPHPKISTSICVNGHNKDIVGRYSDGSCKVCVSIQCKKYYEKNKKRMNKISRGYYKKHKKKIRKINKKWRIDHQEETNKKLVEKRKTNVEFKLAYYIRARLHAAIKRNTKAGSAVKDLGCSLESFKKYIENMFYGKMSWSNWGTYWQLDHIKELWEFDLTNPAQFKRAVHYTNYQPLTKTDHLKKTIKNATKRTKKKKK